MKLTRAVEYAIRATLQLARWEGGTPIACRRLADEENLPERFLLQILRTLVEQGVLHSTRGVEGGYRLSRSACEISVLQVIEAVEGPIAPMPVNSESLPPSVIGKLRIELAQSVEAARSHLGAVKISDLIANEVAPAN